MTDAGTSSVVPHAVDAGARRRPDPLAVLAGLVVVAAVAVRIGFAARQSYWSDELFSVRQGSGDFRKMLDLGRTEVHTPLYAPEALND